MAIRFALLALCISIGNWATAHAEDKPAPDLKALREQVDKLLVKHYPKATIKAGLEEQTIDFQYQTRKFMIHEPLLTGEWQDAWETIGPKKGGIMGTLTLRSGQYGGQAAVPQAFNKHYFTTHLLAPYSKRLDAHLYVHLYYPGDVPKGFLKDFFALVDDFEKHVQAPGK